jgi:hypothetical protein
LATVFYAAEIFVGVGFAEDIKMFVHYQIEFVLQCLPFPAAGGGAVVLDFYDILFEDKSRFQESLQNEHRKRHKMLSLSRIAYQYRAVLVGLEYAEQFLRNLFNLIAEFRQAGDI